MKKFNVTLALLTYNQEKYIKEAIESVLSQNYFPLEIILSDDYSTDNTYEIIEEITKKYKGEHKIILNKNKRNLGLINHVNKVFNELANGDIILLAAGDDVSLPNRVSDTIKIFKDNPDVYSVSMDYINIDEEGRELKHKLKRIPKFFSLANFYNNKPIPLLGFSRAYKKDIFKQFGALDPSCGVEDSNLVFRALLLGDLYHTNSIGVKYRRISSSLSSKINTVEYSGIIYQRKVDLERARELNFINRYIYDKSMRTIERSKRKHKHLEKLFNTSSKLFYYIKNVSFNKDFSFNEKIVYFKHIIKRIL